MPLRTLIVDDEPLAVMRLEALCRTIPSVELVGSAGDGAGALGAIERLEPDLVLLDIAMPGMTGLGVAKAVEGSPIRPAIVFCTAHDDHAIDAFEVAATDYLLKPVTAERLARAVERVVAMRPASPPTWLTELWVPHRDEMIRIPIAMVDRFEAERDYVRVVSRGRTFLIHETMGAIERRLDPATFIRLHRSTIVRSATIERVRHDGLGVWTAVLAGGFEQRISRSYVADVRRLVAL